jgi:hypothetical protein
MIQNIGRKKLIAMQKYFIQCLKVKTQCYHSERDSPKTPLDAMFPNKTPLLCDISKRKVMIPLLIITHKARTLCTPCAWRLTGCERFWMTPL